MSHHHNEPPTPDVLSNAELFEHAKSTAIDYRQRYTDTPFYQQVSSVIFERHLVGHIRGQYLRARADQPSNNAFVGSVLDALHIRNHAEPAGRVFTGATHPLLFQAYKVLYATVILRSRSPDAAAKKFLGKLNRLTPDAIHDQERFSLGKKILGSVGVTIDFPQNNQSKLSPGNNLEKLAVEYDGRTVLIDNPLTLTPLPSYASADFARPHRPHWGPTPYGTLVDFPVPGA